MDKYMTYVGYGFLSCLEKEVKDLAREWSIDYKPLEDDLSPQEYAQYGFEQGYLWALQHIAQADPKRYCFNAREMVADVMAWSGSSQAEINKALKDFIPSFYDRVDKVCISAEEYKARIDRFMDLTTTK